MEVRTLFIEPASPWENGYIESFNGQLPDELLNGEIFYTLREAKVLIQRWRQHYNHVRPHSSLGYRPPAPEVIAVPAIAGYPRRGGSTPIPQASFPLREEEVDQPFPRALLEVNDGLT